MKAMLFMTLLYNCCIKRICHLCSNAIIETGYLTKEILGNYKNRRGDKNDIRFYIDLSWWSNYSSYCKCLCIHPRNHYCIIHI